MADSKKWNSPSQDERKTKKFGTTLKDEAFALLEALAAREQKPNSEIILCALRAFYGVDPYTETGMTSSIATKKPPRK